MTRTHCRALPPHGWPPAQLAHAQPIPPSPRDDSGGATRWILEVLAPRRFGWHTLQVFTERGFTDGMERDPSTDLRPRTGTTANAGTTADSPGSLTASRLGRET